MIDSAVDARYPQWRRTRRLLVGWPFSPRR